MVTTSIDGSRDMPGGRANMPGSRANVRQSHPRLIPVEELRERVQPEGWSRNDTLFVVLMCIAVALCSMVPLALI